MAQSEGGGGNNDGGGGGNKKSQSQEEVQPVQHPVKEQLPDVQYCINSPPPWRPYHSFYSLLSISTIIPFTTTKLILSFVVKVTITHMLNKTQVYIVCMLLTTQYFILFVVCACLVFDCKSTFKPKLNVIIEFFLGKNNFRLKHMFTTENQTYP